MACYKQVACDIVKNFSIIFVSFMCLNVLPACMSVWHVDVQWPKMSKEGIVAPRTGVMDGCQLPYGCWKLSRSFATLVSALNP